MAICPVCNNENADDARFCGSCGEPLRARKPEAPAALAIKFDGEGYCQLCRKRVRTFRDRCESCGEPTDVPPAPAPQPAATPGAAPGADPAVEEMLARMGISPDDPAAAEVRRKVAEAMAGRVPAPAQPQAQPVMPQAPEPGEHDRRRESVRMGQQGKSLEKQRECFICLGTVGVNEEPMICPGCQIAYHETCARDVGVCPNCNHVFVFQ